MQSRNVGVNDHGVVGIIYHESGFGPGRFFHMLFLDVVDFHLVLFAAFGIVGGESCGFLEGPVRDFLPFCLEDDMGAGHLLGMKPPVVCLWQIKSKLIVRVIFISHQQVEAVTA